MKTYIAQFIVYILAMTGALLIAYIVYKKTLAQKLPSKNSNFKILDSIRLQDKTILYAIKYGDENFLMVSSDAKTASLLKLDKTEETVIEEGSLLKRMSDNNRTKRSNY